MDLLNELVRRGLHPDGGLALERQTTELQIALPELVRQLDTAGFRVPVCVLDGGSLALFWARIDGYVDPNAFGLVLVSSNFEGRPDQLTVSGQRSAAGDWLFEGPRSLWPLVAYLLPALLDRLAEVVGTTDRMVKALAAVQRGPA